MKVLHEICIWLVLALIGLGAGAAEPKRVLFIHSFGRDFGPYYAVSGLLRTQLASQMAEPIELFDATLDSARFSNSLQEGPLLNYLHAEFARKNLDLVVPIGGPAVQFVQRHRQELYPEIPMLIVADHRLLDRTKLTVRDAAVLMANDPALTVETILQVLPGTTHVVVVIGNSALERFWVTELRRDLQFLTNRVGFVWLNELPFSEIRKRCAALPPGSAIFLPLLCIDGGGVPHLEEHALLKLHEVANAPIFGIMSSQLGRGVLGGRMIDVEEYGRNAADAAVRILRKESPGSIQIPPQKAGRPQFDWREIRRWGISEARLPTGSVVRFRPPGVWEQYWWLVCGAVLFSAAEAALIVGLLINQAKRREGEAVTTLIAELSARFIHLPAGTVDREIEEAQRRVCESMGLDLSALWQWTDGPPRYFKMTHLHRPLAGPPIPERFDGQEVFPWCLRKLLAGEVIAVSSLAELPVEASRDRKSWLHFGIKSNLTFPLLIEGGQLIGGLSFNTVRKERSWPEELVTRLELVAQIFANALARKRADQELRESEARLSLAAEAAAVGLWRLDIATNAFWLTNKTRELFAFAADEVVTFDRFVKLVHPEDRELVRQKVQQILESKGEVQVEYRILQPDGRVQWMSSRGRVHCDGSGQPKYLMGVTVDATPRKQTEESLKASEQRFRILAESSLVGTYVLQDDRYQYVNPAMACIFGYSAAEMTGMNPSQIVQPSDQAMVSENIRRRISGEVRSLRYEVRGRHKDGSTRNVEVYGSRLEINGRPALVGTLIDFTDRKRAEEALRETQTTLHAIIDSTSDLVWSVDSRSFGLMTFNQGLRDYFLRGRGILIETGMRPEDLFPPGRYVREWREFYQRALDAGPFTVEYLTYTHNVLLQLSFNILKREDQVFGISVFGKDITDLKRTQSALEESLDRFRQVVEFAGEFIWEVNPDGLYTYASPSVTKLLEYAPEELVGKKHFFDLFEPSVREELKAAALQGFATHQSFRNFPNPNVTRSGKIVHLETSGLPLLDPQGKLLGYRGADADVTERMKAQQVLLEAEEAARRTAERLSLAQRAGRVGVFDWDLITNHTVWTPELEEIFGLRPKESENHYEGWTKRVHPEDLPRLEKMFATWFASDQEEAEWEYRFLRRGEERWIAARGRVFRDDSTGRPLRLIGTNLDITERKLVEERARESEARLASAVEVAGLGFYEMGSDPGQIFVDERLRSLLGLTPEDNHRVLEFWIEHITSDDRERVLEVSRKLLSGELQWAMVEYRYQHPERGTLWFSHVSRAQEQDAAGKVVRRFGVIRDITEQRRAELESQQLRNNLAHLTRMNTLGALSGSLAHELNQPFGIILSNAQAAQEMFLQQPPDLQELAAALADIVAADRRAGEVIQRLRGLFRQGEVSLKPLSLNELIEEVLRLINSDLIGRGVNIIRDLAADLPQVAGDRVQLQQVFINLILNASDAMSANAPGMRRLHLHTKRVDRMVRAAVRDEGDGLPKDVECLFQPFYTTKTQGLGLGLAICRSIINAHHGRLWAEPHSERGAVFQFELPVTDITTNL